MPTHEIAVPPDAVTASFRRGEFMEGARLWAAASGAPLPAVSMWCLNWLDANAKVRSRRASVEKYCNDTPGRRVADCIHCGDECRA